MRYPLPILLGLLLAAICRPVFAEDDMRLPTAPPTGYANVEGAHSYTPYQAFSTGESINLTDGHLIINPQDFTMQVGEIGLSITPTFNPDKDKLGLSDYIFSGFHEQGYGEVDDYVYTLPTDAPLGRLARLVAERVGEKSFYRISTKVDQWQFAVNGIVGAVGMEIELGKEDKKLTAYFLIKADGQVIFISTADKGFRKNYKIIGSHHFDQIDIQKVDDKDFTVLRDRLMIEDQNSTQYTFSSRDGFGYQKNLVAQADLIGTSPADVGFVKGGGGTVEDVVGAQSYIETETCYFVIWKMGKQCDKHYNFPGWQARLFFLTNISDKFGNEVRIKAPGGANSLDPNNIVTLVQTGQTTIGVIEKPDQVQVRTHYGTNSPAKATWTYTRDGEGRITKLVDPEGTVRTYAYGYASGLPQVRKIGPVFSEDPTNILEITNPLGGVSRYEIFTGAVKGVIATEFPDASDPGDFFQKYVVSMPLLTRVYDTGGAITMYQYANRAGVNVLTQRSLEYNGKVYTETYDWAETTGVDPETGEEKAIVNGMGTITSIVDGVPVQTVNQYDSYGRLIASTHPANGSISYAYHCDSNDVKSITRTKTMLNADGGIGNPQTLTLNFKPFLPVECSYANVLNLDVKDIRINVDWLALIIRAIFFANPTKAIALDEAGQEIMKQIEQQLITPEIKATVADVLMAMDAIPALKGIRAALLNHLNIVSEQEMDSFEEYRNGMQFLREQVMANLGPLVQQAAQFVADGGVEQHWNEVYQYIDAAYTKLFSLIPVKPRLPYILGQVELVVDGAAIPIKRYLYEIGAETNEGDGNRWLAYRNLIAELDHEGVMTTYLYHYCDVMAAAKLGSKGMDMDDDGVKEILIGCDHLKDYTDPANPTKTWRYEQLNQQLLTAIIEGEQPSELAQTYIKFNQLLEKDKITQEQVADFVQQNLPAAQLHIYNVAAGKILAQVDTNLLGHCFNFNKLGELARIIYFNGSQLIRTLNVAKRQMITTTKDSTRAGKELSTIQQLDGLGLTRSTTDAQGHVTSFNYHRNKKVAQVVYPNGGGIFYEYDGLDRVTRVAYPGGETFYIAYGRDKLLGLQGPIPVDTATVVQNGNLILRYYLDAAQRVVGVDRFGGAPAMARYWYDELGNLVKTQDAAGNITIHVVDSRSRLAKLAEPHGADLNVSYAGFAQPSQVAVPGAAGDLIHTITYDTKGRIQEVAQQVDGVTKPYVKFTYDELIGKIPFTSDLIPKFGLQRTTHVTDPHGEYDYFYEPDGGTFAITRQLVGIPGVPDLPPLGSVHVRDGFSNPVQTAYPSPSGFKVKYATDVLGRLGKVTDGSGKTFASYSYDAGGELQAMTYGNGIAQSFTYHPTGRIASMRLAKGDKELLYERYNYDGVGRKTEILHGDGARVTYAYDGRGDLLKVEYYKAKGDQPYYVQAYTYDANGNRLSYADNFRLMTYTYKGNQLTEYTTGPTGKVALTYDPQGRVLHEEERSDNTVVLARDYMYDPHGRLMQLTIQDAHTGYQANIAYQYDAQGRREVKTVNGVPTIYYYGDDAYPLSEFQADPKNPAEPHERHYIYAGGHRIAVLDGTEIRYFHDIDLRSPVATTDQSGKVRHRIRFDPFGNATFELGNNPYGFGFMGEQHDAESGLYYMGDGSYYDPRTGRYLNRTDDSLNAYRFPLGQSAAGQEVVFDNMPSPETGTGFLDIKATPVAIASVAQFAQEGVDDVGGAGFVCVNVSVSNVGVDVPLALRAALVPGNALFGSGNVSINGAFSGCADAGEPFGTATSVIGNKIKGEAAEAAKGAAKAWIRKALWQNLLFPANPMTALVSVLNALYEIYKVLKSIGDFLGGFFGLGGVSYEVLDHPPEGFSDIQIFSLQNNRLLFDPSFLSRLTPYFTVGQKSFVYLQLLEDIGVAPQANYSPTVVGPFGLRNAVIKPIDQFRVSGQFTGGAFLGWSYMKFGP